MKLRFMLNNLFFLLLLYCSLLAAPQGYKEIECTIQPMGTLAIHKSHPHIPGPRAAGKKSNKSQETSTNWSGYAALNNLNNPKPGSVTAVAGTWIVPTVISSGPSRYSDSAIWVGIDGFSNSTVEQIGTSHNWVTSQQNPQGAQQNYAWFEMYPGGSYSINGFPLNRGDVISASVVYSGNNIFTLTLINETQRVTFTVPTSYTKSATAKRQSAEWIVEAPYLNGILPLSDFQTAFFNLCTANINGILANLNNNSWPNVSLEMVTNSGIPKAIPSAIQSNQNFSVQWKHQ